MAAGMGRSPPMQDSASDRHSDFDPRLIMPGRTDPDLPLVLERQGGLPGLPRGSVVPLEDFDGLHWSQQSPPHAAWREAAPRRNVRDSLGVARPGASDGLRPGIERPMCTASPKGLEPVSPPAGQGPPPKPAGVVKEWLMAADGRRPRRHRRPPAGSKRANSPNGFRLLIFF